MNYKGSDGLSYIKYSDNKLCRKCFAFLYNFTVYEIEQACNRLKENWLAESFVRERWEDDHLHPYNYSEVDYIFKANLDHETAFFADRPYDDSMITDALLPVGENDVDVALWLEDLFDHAPNKVIHQISSTFKADVYKQYLREMGKLSNISKKKL